MKFVRRRYQRVLVALGAISTVVTPVVVTQVLSSSTPAAATTYDTITYTQTSGAKGTYLQFKNAAGTTVVNQSITGGGGGCSSPTVKSSTPILTFSANEYPNGYANAPAPAGTASVGAYQQRTGVCFTPQDWSIEYGEGLDFAVGTYPTYVAGRVFLDAQLNIERWSDKTSSNTLTVQLAEWLNGTQVGQEDCTIGAAGTTTLIDTNPAANPQTCTVDTGYKDPTVTGFDTIEVRNLLQGGSVSVVGPTSNFSLANQICGGNPPNNQISTSSADGSVTATLTLTGTSSQCKSYTAFTASSLNPDGSRSVEFDSFSITGVPFTVSVNWGNFDPACAPTDNGTGMPVCPLTEFELNGQTTFSPETFCSGATPADPLCVTSRDYSYLAEPAGSDDVGGVSDDGPGTAEQNSDVTQITENWSGLIDWIGRS